MEFIEWDESLSVKKSLIDSQHKRLISIMNDLIEAFNQERKKGHIQVVLDSLISSVHQHFSSEESLLRSSGFPNYTEHKKGHDLLLEKIISFQALFKSDKISLTIDVMQYLRNWLTHHIAESDIEFKGTI